MPKWIHDRAEHIRKKNPDMDEGMSYALATQQAHRLGKSPKTFKSKVTGKKERFGTPEARREAKMKLNKPKSEYQKTAESKWKTMMRTGQLGENEVKRLLKKDILNVGRETGGAMRGVAALQKKRPGEDIREAMSRMKHLSENRLKTASEKMMTDLETNEPSTAGEMPHQSTGSDNLTNVGSPAPTNVSSDLGRLFDNKVETHQGKETTLSSMSSATPTIKTAMYEGFLDEFNKLAARTVFHKSSPINIQRPSGVLMRVRKFLTGSAMKRGGGKGAKMRAQWAAEDAERLAKAKRG